MTKAEITANRETIIGYINWLESRLATGFSVGWVDSLRAARKELAKCEQALREIASAD